MKVLLILCAALGGLATMWSASVEAQKIQWKGANSCGSCHPKEYKKWQQGPHAKASESIEGNLRSAVCETCHRTGAAPVGRNTLENVQCEACHGAGGHYSAVDVMKNQRLAYRLGLKKLSTTPQRASVCMRCHIRSISILPFEVEKAWIKIAH